MAARRLIGGSTPLSAGWLWPVDPSRAAKPPPVQLELAVLRVDEFVELREAGDV